MGTKIGEALLHLFLFLFLFISPFILIFLLIILCLLLILTRFLLPYHVSFLLFLHSYHFFLSFLSSHFPDFLSNYSFFLIFLQSFSPFFIDNQGQRKVICFPYASFSLTLILLHSHSLKSKTYVLPALLTLKGHTGCQTPSYLFALEKN